MGAKEGLLSSGFTCACLKVVTNVPVDSKALTTMCGCCHNMACRRVVIESSGQEVGQLPVRSLDSSTSAGEVKEEKTAVGLEKFKGGTCEEGSDRVCSYV